MDISTTALILSFIMDVLRGIYATIIIPFPHKNIHSNAVTRKLLSLL